MDEQPSQAPVADSSVQDTSLPAEGTTPTPQDTSTVNDSASTPAPSQNTEPQGDPTETPDEDVPDRGIDPDKGIDPDAGDEPTKGMTRAERAAYYGEIERSQRQETEQAISAAYQTQDVAELQQQYLNEYPNMDEGTALMLARQDVAEQKSQIAEASAEITQLNANLQVDALEARTRHEWMNPESKGFDKQTAGYAAQLFELGTVKDARTGQIIDVKLTPSQVADVVQNIRETAMKAATSKARKDAELEMASVAPPTSQTTRREPSFEDLSPADMRAQLLAKGINVT